MERYSFPGQNLDTIVGNGPLVARSRAGSVEFVFGGPVRGLRLLADGQPVDDRGVETRVRPARSVYRVGGLGEVSHACDPERPLYLLLVEPGDGAGEATWTLEVSAEGAEASGGGLACASGRVEVWGADGECAAGEGGGSVTARASGRVAFLVGTPAAVEAFSGDPFEAALGWERGVGESGLRLRTPDERINLAPAFMQHHMRLGDDGEKMVCDLFRWRDVWSRDFGSGFGPGGIVAGEYDAVLRTFDYETARYRAHDPRGLKVSDDTSQGGSAEGLGWLLKLVWRMYKHTGDAEWLEDTFAAFEPWLAEWLARDTDEDGLIVDSTEWMDHSRFLRLVEGQRTLYSNALFYAAQRRAAVICDVLGRPGDADRYRGLAQRTRTALHDGFWNPAGYFDNAVQWGVPDTALMLADNVIAVAEKVASRNERYRVLESIRERLWRPSGTATCDPPMRYAEADNDHNGHVWPWWMAHEAKARFLNFDAEGGLLVTGKSLDTLERATLPGLIEEYVEPQGGQDTLAGHAFITGAGATLDSLLYGLVGLSIREPGERALRLAPASPRDWESWSADVALHEGELSFDETPVGYRVVLDGTRASTFELRIPPREAVATATVNGRTAAVQRQEHGASEFLQFKVAPGRRHEIQVEFEARRVFPAGFVVPEALPPPLGGHRAVLMDEPRLFADVLQGFIRHAASYFGSIRHAAAREIGELDGSEDLLMVVGNEMPLETKKGASVPDMLDAYLDRGGAMLLLGPRFARIDLRAHYHKGAQMGEKAGMWWWKVWRDGEWRDYDRAADEVVPEPRPQGAVYWGEGPLLPAWEHKHGLFGFETPCTGVFDALGNEVDGQQRVEIVYTDWAVRKPWRFVPLAFTERDEALLTGPRRERYPCAAVLLNAETGARIAVVAPALCSRPDLLHPMLELIATATEPAKADAAA